MVKLTIKEAAKYFRPSERTIWRHIDKQEIHDSQVIQEGKTKYIYIQELIRVYGNPVLPLPGMTQNQSLPNPDNSDKLSQTNPGIPSEPSFPDSDINSKELIAVLKEQLDREKERADKFEEKFFEAEEQLKGFLLPAPKEEKKKGFLGLFKR